MQFSPSDFENFLRQLTATREQVDGIFSSSVSSERMCEASMILLWQSIYDTLMTVREPEERLKWGALIEKLFSAFTARRALELRESLATEPDKKSSAKPTDAKSLTDLEARLKLL